MINPQNLELAQQLRHELHAHPELSCQEVWTRQRLIDFLRENTSNLEIVDPAAGYFYAKYNAGEGLPVIAFRADFDAVPVEEGIALPWASQNPGVSHKCGHDGHSATLACFALEVDQKGAPCNILFLFQDAEEVGVGAPVAVNALLEEGACEVYGLHNWSDMAVDEVHLIDGPTMPASKGMTVHMVGAPSHAAEPENGINPAFAIAKIVEAIPRLTDPSDKKGYVMCTIVQVDVGSLNFGVQASEGSISMTLRAQYEDEINDLQHAIEAMAEESAKEQGMTVDFSFNDEFPALINDSSCANRVRKACESAGIKWNDLPSPSPVRASEDFGNYTRVIPGCFFYVGNGMGYPPVHTTEFDFRDPIIGVGTEVYKQLAGME